MSTVTTTKPINARQLTTELGAGVVVSDNGTTRVVRCDDPAITQAGLQAAIDAHVAIDEQGNRATLEQQALAAMQNNRDDIAANAAYKAIANPTNAQIAARVKALGDESERQARQLNGVARLILGKLDATT